MHKTVYVYTAEFPYGKGETFLENEIGFLANHFEKVIIVPFSARGEPRAVPSNCEIKSFQVTPRNVSVTEFFFLTRTWFHEWLHANKKGYYLLHARKWFSLLKQALVPGDYIQKECAEKNSVHYSYWMNDWALALAVLKRRGWKNNFVFRCGGFDIWNERHPGNYLPFRYTIYQQTSAVYPNSQQAETYIKQLGVFPHKVQCLYWGTPDHGLGKIPTANDVFTVVSCSAIIPLKRVHLIASLLGATGKQIRWIHFGDGPEMENVKKHTATFKNIEAVFKGNVSNATVHEYYRQQPVHMFITTSSTEGLPVSVQEAISYGIPVAATHVGGMREVVPANSGLLMNAEIDIPVVAQQISVLLEKSSDPVFRNATREYWLQHFKAETVYNRFGREIEKFIS